MGMTKVQIELSLTHFKKLANYLEVHESDIADDINDYGDLLGVFVTVFEEEPKRHDETKP